MRGEINHPFCQETSELYTFTHLNEVPAWAHRLTLAGQVLTCFVSVLFFLCIRVDILYTEVILGSFFLVFVLLMFLRQSQSVEQASMKLIT